jgi:hypothetical protein
MIMLLPEHVAQGFHVGAYHISSQKDLLDGFATL